MKMVKIMIGRNQRYIQQKCCGSDPKIVFTHITSSKTRWRRIVRVLSLTKRIYIGVCF